MLLDREYVIIPQLRFTLTYSDGTRRVVNVKTNDIVTCTYKRNGERLTIEGQVSKIGCNFNSSLGAVGTTAYMQIDGSQKYAGEVVYVKPSQVLDLVVDSSSSGDLENVVCSVDNEDQKITLIRQNEVGVFQYSLDGITWKAATGAQGMSAYECAVELGFEGTEEEWLESLVGPKGDPGTLHIDKHFRFVNDMLRYAKELKIGSLVSLLAIPSSLLYIRVKECSCGCCDHNDDLDTTTVEIDGKQIPMVRGYDFVGFLSVGEKGEKGDPGEDGVDGEDGAPGKNGKDAYEYAVEAGYLGTPEEFARDLANAGVAATTFYMGGPSPITFENTVIGPIDLRIFGYTEPITLKSVSVSKIDISSVNEETDQSLIFDEPIILRAIPVTSDATQPNLIINDVKYVADCITRQGDQIGVYRRIKHTDSYNGEIIVGDWMSSTGEVDLGAEIQWVSIGKFYPFDELVQDQYRKLHTYDSDTTIHITEPAYFSLVYPINIEEYIESRVGKYVEDHKNELIRPVVEEVFRETIDIPEGQTISEYVDAAISDVVGALPEGKTVAETIADTAQEINDKIGELPEGKTVTDIVSDVDNKIGTLPEGKTAAEAIADVDDKIGTLPEGKTVVETINDAAQEINDKIGTVPEGETVVDMITDVENTIGTPEEGKTVVQMIEETNDAIGTLPEGKTVVETIADTAQEINNKIGTVPEGETVVSMITNVEDSIGELPEGRTVTDIVDEVNQKSVISEDITVKNTVGGVIADTVIPAGTSVSDIINSILNPDDPENDTTLYSGASAEVPTSLSGLTAKQANTAVITDRGISMRFTADDEYLVFVYDAELGELSSIKDENGLEQIYGWSYNEIIDGGKTYLNYYSNEPLTIDNYELNFIYNA